MLIKILKILAEEGLYSNKLMATKLGVDESLVQQMIDKLIQIGYIEKEKIDSCGGGCTGCSNKECSWSKSKNSKINIWRVTNRGKNAISK